MLSARSGFAGWATGGNVDVFYPSVVQQQAHFEVITLALDAQYRAAMALGGQLCGFSLTIRGGLPVG